MKVLATHLAMLLPRRSNEVLAIMPTKYTATRTEVILATNVPIHGTLQDQPNAPMRITLDDGTGAELPPLHFLSWLHSQEMGHEALPFTTHVHIVQALLINLFEADKKTLPKAQIRLSYYITYTAASGMHARLRQETRNFWTVIEDVDLPNRSLTPDLKVALPRSRIRLRETLEGAVKLKPADVPPLDLPTDEEWTQLQSYTSDQEARIFHKLLTAVLRGTLASLQALKQFKVKKVSKRVSPADQEEQHEEKLVKDPHYTILYAVSWCAALAELVSNYEDALSNHLKFIQRNHPDAKSSVSAERKKPTEDVQLDEKVWGPGVPDGDLHNESTAPGIDGKVKEDLDETENLEYDPELESELRDYEREWADEALQWLKVASAHHTSICYFWDNARFQKTAAKDMLCRLKIRVLNVEPQIDDGKMAGLEKLIDEASPTLQNKIWFYKWFNIVNASDPSHRKTSSSSIASTCAYHFEAILLSLVLLNKLRVRATDIKDVLDISDATIRSFRISKFSLSMTKRSCPTCFKLIRATQSAMQRGQKVTKFEIDFPAYSLRHTTTALPPFLPAVVAKEVFTSIGIALDNGFSRLNDAIHHTTMTRRRMKEQADTEREDVEGSESEAEEHMRRFRRNCLQRYSGW